MRTYLKGGRIYLGGVMTENKGFMLDESGIVSMREHCSGDGNSAFFADLDGCIILPAFTDVHVHLREPGFSYKETIRSGTKAAACGGYACVCSMPNVKPSPCDEEGLKAQLSVIEKDACVDVRPYASITVNSEGKELVDFEKLKALGAVAFSDDGKGVQDGEVMEQAMRAAAKADVIIAAHCEDNSLLNGGYIHDGEYCKRHGHRGICSESEWGPIARDLYLAEKAGVKYHVCHVSSAESVELIRQAKKRGVNVTCETGPHYLVLNDEMLQEDGRFKMNPPIRSERDRQALIEGILDGTIDMIATDHAPHSAEEKSKGLAGSLMGVVGLETAFPVLYTELVLKNIISLEKLVSLMAINPAKRFGITGGLLEDGKPGRFVIFDTHEEYAIDPEAFATMGRSTPFTGMRVKGRLKAFVYNKVR